MHKMFKFQHEKRGEHLTMTKRQISLQKLVFLIKFLNMFSYRKKLSNY